VKPAPWRTGRKLKRTLYERVYTDAPSDDDRFVGIMDTPEDAQRVVDAVNLPHALNEWRITGRMSCDCCVDLHHVTCEHVQTVPGGDLVAVMLTIRDHTCGGRDDA
jgi:hypothetical protein